MADAFDDLRAKYGVGKPVEAASDGFDDLRSKYGVLGPAAAPPPDRVASGGLSSLITGKPSVPVSESAARGGLQGATLGFGDEASALIDAAAAKIPGLRTVAQKLHDDSLPPIDDSNVTYQQRRDAYRQRNANAQQANPVTYGAAEIAGGIAAPIPGGTAIKGATTLGKVASIAKTGAKIGGLAGLGTSTADLTNGEIGQAALDTAKGAATGAVVAPVVAGGAKVLGKLVGGASRAVSDVNAGATKAPAKLRNDVKFKAGEEGQTLTEVIAELPDVRHAVTVRAKTDPGGAAKVVQKAIAEATDANDAAFAAIQRQHRGVQLQPILERLDGVAERLRLQGRAVSAKAVRRVRKTWDQEFGGQPDSMLSAQQIRNIRNDIGEVMDPARTIKPNKKRQAEAKIYEVLNKEIDDVASNTSGVDLPSFKARNRQISTLIPVRKALEARAESQGDRSLVTKAKAIPGNAIRRGIREIDYRLGGQASTPITAAAARARNDVAAFGLSPALAEDRR